MASVDVTDETAVEDFADAVVDRFGRIDLWVNNAGVLAPIGPLRAAPADQLEAHVRINVVGVLLGSRAYARHVRSRPGGGALVNISSGASTNPYAGWAAYCASKAAVDHLTRVVAIEEADAGLRAPRGGAGRGRHRHAGRHPGHAAGRTSRRSTASSAWPRTTRSTARRGSPTGFSTWRFGATTQSAGGGRDVVVRIPDEPRYG